MAPVMTPPFPGNVRPARPGLYERRILDVATRLAYWTGARWTIGSQPDDLPSTFQPGDAGAARETSWRDLAEPPPSR